MNDLAKTPYISDEKSCITGLNGLSAILNNKGNALNTSQDSHALDYSHIDNLTNFNFHNQTNMLREADNISACNFATAGLNFKALNNNRGDWTEQNSQCSDGEFQSATRFEGGEEEEREGGAV